MFFLWIGRLVCLFLGITLFAFGIWTLEPNNKKSLTLWQSVKGFIVSAFVTILGLLIFLSGSLLE